MCQGAIARGCLSAVQGDDASNEITVELWGVRSATAQAPLHGEGAVLHSGADAGPTAVGAPLFSPPLVSSSRQRWLGAGGPAAKRAMASAWRGERRDAPSRARGEQGERERGFLKENGWQRGVALPRCQGPRR